MLESLDTVVLSIAYKLFIWDSAHGKRDMIIPINIYIYEYIRQCSNEMKYDLLS